VVIWAELGDARRFPTSRNAVRHTGPDIPGRHRVLLGRQAVPRSPGPAPPQIRPALLRWALYEAALAASRSGSPDHAYYQQVAARLGNQRAILSVARRLARRCQHRLRALGEEAFTDVTAAVTAA